VASLVVRRPRNPSRLMLMALGIGVWSIAFVHNIAYSTEAFSSPVKIEGSRFVRDGREIIVSGINYFPAYYPALYPDSWLTKRNYRPDLIEDELSGIEKLAFNLVSIQGFPADLRPSEQDCSNLRDFLGRAKRHRLLVNLYIGDGGLVPIADPEKLTVIPGDCKLAGNPTLFAYDIAWEPRFGPAARRNALLQPWLRWLTVSYGSIEAADENLGGTHAMPTDVELCVEAPSVRVSAFQRFLDDTLSHNYRDVRAALLRVDSRHLIGVRSGYGGNGSRSACGLAPVNLRAGAKHLDFISPEGYALDTSDSNNMLNRGAFTTAYADVGKPILWAEFGINVDRSCVYCSEDVQASFFSNMWELVRHGNANGAIAWWFVGVRPQAPLDGERSDFGIVYDYLKYPTSVDGSGNHARSGSLALCTSDATRENLTQWQPGSAGEKTACPRGLSSRGRFRSEAPLGRVSDSYLDSQSKQASGWQELCSRDDSALLVTTADEGSGETFACSHSYRAMGSFKPADSSDKSPIIAIDANHRSLKAGWLTLCTRNNPATLKLVYNEMSRRKTDCALGTVVAGILIPKSAPVFRPAARQVVGALSSASAVKRNYSSWITVDRDAYSGEWKMYEEATRKYSVAGANGQNVGVQTTCIASTSRVEKFCVGNVSYSKSCPAKCLDAEWNTVEILNGDRQWQRVQDGETVTVSRAAPINARFSAGNIGESRWLNTSVLGGNVGAVRFGCNENAGDLTCRSEITVEVPGGSDASSGNVAISGAITRPTRIAFQMVAEGVAWFGERLNVTVVPK
jgi:hypothetical protein